MKIWPRIATNVWSLQRKGKRKANANTADVNVTAVNVTDLLSVNIRSQLSSMAKNFDTLYERTFAEPINLHLRCPKMVLGEVYMIPTYEYSIADVQQKRIRFVKGVNSVEKYLRAFQAINNRLDENDDDYKYEKVCLLVVDFSTPIPKIYNSDAELVADGLLSAGSTASISDLTFNGFAQDLVDAHTLRF